jgi:Sulfotransferase family
MLSGMLGPGRYALISPHHVWHKSNGDWKEALAEVWGAGGHQAFEQSPIVLGGKPRVYVSMVREPFERFISFYSHVQRNPDHHLNRRRGELRGMDPLGFARALAEDQDQELSNLQSRMLSGKISGSPDAETAIGNIERHFSLVGCIEFPAHFESGIAALTGRPASAFPHERRRPQAAPAGSRALRDLIYALNEEDLKVYEHVKRRCLEEGAR